MDYTLEEKYARIREDALAAIGRDSVRIAHEIMRRDTISMHGPEHHFLDGAAFLAAYRNAGGQNARRNVRSMGYMRFGSLCGRGTVCYSRNGAAEYGRVL